MQVEIDGQGVVEVGPKSGTDRPYVYFAGPIDYVEHQSPRDHRLYNWRHRFFGELPIHILCPTCLNVESKDWDDVMETNSRAVDASSLFVGYFPGDVATFGTPIEVMNWLATSPSGNTAALIHPSKPGVFVQMYQAHYGLTVVRSFDEARQWLRRRF